jgi:hypothetical protein
LLVLKGDIFITAGKASLQPADEAKPPLLERQDNTPLFKVLPFRQAQTVFLLGCLKSAKCVNRHCGLAPQSPNNQYLFFGRFRVKREMTDF